MTKGEFLALAASRYDDLQRLNQYEEAFAQLWTELDRSWKATWINYPHLLERFVM